MKRIFDIVVNFIFFVEIFYLKDNNTYISFKENIDQYQDLDVEIQLTQNQDRYKIIKWQAVTSKEWKNESTLPLLGSE